MMGAEKIDWFSRTQVMYKEQDATGLGTSEFPNCQDGWLRGSEPRTGRGLTANCTPHCPQHITDIPERRGRELISC